MGIVRLVLGVFLLYSGELWATELLAHRGASFEAPENTFEAAQLAYDLGASAVECDIHLTADGVLVLLHDQSLKRTTGVDRLVQEVSYTELKDLDAGRWKEERWAGVRIPRLAELVTAVPEGRRLFVELKADDRNEAMDARLLGALVDFYAKLPMAVARRLTFMSFHHSTLLELKKQLPAAETYFLLSHRTHPGEWPYLREFDDLKAYIELAKRHGIEGLFLEYGTYLGKAVFEAIRAHNLKVAIWIYASDDTPGVIRQGIDWGVDYQSTNDPRRMGDLFPKMRARGD